MVAAGIERSLPMERMYNFYMSPRVQELIWAFSMIAVLVSLFMSFTNPKNSFWFFFMLAVCGVFFTYMGVRTLFEKDYPEKTHVYKLIEKDHPKDKAWRNKYSKHPINR